MRKSLWIITVLFAAIVVPCANADSITDAITITNLGSTPGTVIPNLDDPKYTFVCCNTAPASPEVTDLEATFNAAVTSSLVVDGPGAIGCAVSFAFNHHQLIDTCTTINPGATISVTVGPAAATLVSADWTVSGIPVASATPIPEPATIGLTLLGFGMLVRKCIAQRSRRAT
jgi:PEP-CTERM motif